MMVNNESSRFTRGVTPIRAALPTAVSEGLGTGSQDMVAARRPHLKAFGFQRDPFPVVPDLTGFYLSQRNEIVVSEVLHTIEGRRGFMVLTGEVGLGKTTLSRRILTELEERGVQTALIFNTFFQGVELLREINKDFGLQPAGNDLPSHMAALNQLLLSHLERGINSVIMIDDAQQLSVESLELLRQVSNLETEQEKLVQIVLIGQPELDTTLQAHELRQLTSRIVLRHRLQPYTLEETRQYVQLKLMRATSYGRLQVTESAFRCLHRLSAGNPRRINLLMDRSLYAVIAFARDKIDRRLLTDVVRDLEIEPQRGSAGRLRLLIWSALALWLGLALVEPSMVIETLSRGNPSDEMSSVSRLTARNVDPWQAARQPETPEPSTSATTGSAQDPEPAPAESTPRPDAVSAWQSFMAAYGLQGYSEELAAALETGFVDEPASKIRLDTGLRLVSLPDRLPWQIEGYERFHFRGRQVDEMLLFWCPQMWSLQRLYFQYVPSEVLALQQALLRLGHYYGALDGSAGPLTSRALRRFQSTVNLPPSGMPDTATLFLLEYLILLEPSVPGPISSLEQAALPAASAEIQAIDHESSTESDRG